jgi:hypothetical protein
MKHFAWMLNPGASFNESMGTVCTLLYKTAIQAMYVYQIQDTMFPNDLCIHMICKIAYTTLNMFSIF